MIDQGMLRQKIMSIKNVSDARVVLYTLVECSFQNEEIGKILDEAIEGMKETQEGK